MSTVGILANPLSGRDVRRIAARASTTTVEHKREQVARIAIGAAAAGAQKLLLLDEPFRVSSAAVENLGLEAEVELLDVGGSLTARDTSRATEAMRDADCKALVVLGGDGTSRIVTKTWRDAPLLPLSTGTNNVFPETLEATVAGAAAGLVASGAVRLEECSTQAKVIEATCDDVHDLALIDAALIVGDHLGNVMPFEPDSIRQLFLTRAEAHAVGMSPIGGLVEPCAAEDDFGLEIALDPDADVRPLLVPLSPGLYRQVRVTKVEQLALSEEVSVTGPGLLEFDGDRAMQLADGQSATIRILRNGPRVINAARAMRLGAQAGAFQGSSEEFCSRAFHGSGCC